MVFKNQTATERKEIKAIKEQIESANTKVIRARDLLLEGKLDADDYRTIKAECEAKITNLEFSLFNNKKEEKKLLPMCDWAISNLEKIDLLYVNESTEERRQIVGSMFPEKITFDGEQHRTTRINEAAQLICLIADKIEGIKKGTSLDFSNLSLEVIPLGSRLCPKTRVFSVISIVRKNG